MNFKVFVFSDKIISGKYKFEMEKLQELFAQRDILCKELLFFSFASDLFWQKIEGEIGKENLLVFLSNSKIDGIIYQNFAKLGQFEKTVDEQALVFGKDDNKTIIMPYDVDYLAMLKKILERPVGRKVIALQIFGKRDEEIEKKLSLLGQEFEDLRYTYFSSNLVSKLYLSYKSVQEGIDSKQVALSLPFQDCLFSESELTLANCVLKLLRLKNITLSIVDCFTGGEIIEKFYNDCDNFDDAVKSYRIDKTNSALTSDSVYQMAVEERKFGSDVCLCIDGRENEKGSEVIFAIASKNDVSIFKNTFSIKGQKARGMSANSALYHLFRKLKQNDFAF